LIQVKDGRSPTGEVGAMAGTTVYSALKPFLYPERLAAIAAGDVPAPVHVRIKPTNVCNHSCWFCAYRSDAVSLGSGMNEHDRIPREKMMEIVDDLIAMGVEAVTFSGGGEPLIYPNIAATVERLAAGGIKVGALTNGSMLRGRVADVFARHGTWLRVSIDGWDPASYARSRSVGEDEFYKVIRNLEAFSRRGSKCVLGASVVVDERNASHIFELCAQLKRVGVGHVKIAPCIVRDSAAENDAYHARFEPTVRAQITEIRGLEESHFRVNDHYHALCERFDRSERRCMMAYLLTVIGADLTVYSCQDKAYTEGGALGSIRDQRFREFWASPATAAALAAINPSRDCRHHCVSSVKNERILELLSLDPDHARFV
jgi:MoaA/NifB/PqqE/SkfB family radical SAM enzyme